MRIVLGLLSSIWVKDVLILNCYSTKNLQVRNMQNNWQVTAREEQWLQFLGVGFFLVGFIQIKQQHYLLCELETKTAHSKIQFMASTKV